MSFWWLTGKGTPLTGTIYENPYEGDNPIVEIEYVALQVILKVDPYNGAPETYIIKTFYADNYTWTEQYIRKKQVEYINNVFEMIYFTYLKIIG